MIIELRNKAGVAMKEKLITPMDKNPLRVRRIAVFTSVAAAAKPTAA